MGIASTRIIDNREGYLEAHDDVVVPDAPDAPALARPEEVDGDGVEDHGAGEEVAQLHVVPDIAAVIMLPSDM